MADREPPESNPSNVVPLRAKSKRAAPKPVAGLPDHTGVGAMVNDPLLANLRASALTDDTIDRARLFTLSSAKWREFGFRSGRPQSGLFFPFFAPSGQLYGYRLRPQFPMPAGTKGGTKKYDQPRDTGILVYTPPLAATIEHLRDLAAPLYWTEGEKKALLLAQLGHCVVGLTGVYNWHDVDAKARGEGHRLHEYIREHYEVAGREHVIVFDADARTKPQVQLAMQRLAGVLLAAGALSVRSCLPPDGGGAKGIDDYAQAHGVDACSQLLTTQREVIQELAPDLGCVPLAHYGDIFAGSGAHHLRMPRGYECERDGSVWLVDDPAKPDDRTQVLNAPMVIARQLVDLYTGEIRSEVRFMNARGHWQAATVPREVLGDRGLIAALRPLGAMVNAGTSGSIMRYLDAFEADNGALIEQVHCVPQTGWHRRQFVLADTLQAPGTDATPITLDGSPDLQRLAAAVRPAKGSDHAKHVAALRVAMDASPECTLVVLAALTAPLLHLLDQHNFALHLCGDSSRGKTSMLRVAASVFGDPFSPAWVGSWNSTLFALEQRATMLCDLPQLYDEVGSGDPDKLQDYVYTLINGEGRQRGTKDLRMRTTMGWRTVLLSTGERELADDTSATGAQARVISLPVQGFGALNGSQVDQVVRDCAEHHGQLGRSWLQWLVGLSDEDKAALRDEYKECARDLRKQAEARGDRIGQRQAGFFAAMQVAELQLERYWGLGRKEGATAAEAFSGGAGAEDRRVKPLAERIVQTLRDWVTTEQRCFPPLHGSHDNAPRVLGYQASGDVVNFVPGEIKKYLRSVNLPLTPAVMRDLSESGVLLTDPTLRAQLGTYQVRVTPSGCDRKNVLAFRLGLDR